MKARRFAAGDELVGQAERLHINIVVPGPLVVGRKAVPVVIDPAQSGRRPEHAAQCQGVGQGTLVGRLLLAVNWA